MPTIENPNLTLTESEGLVTVRVRYDARFTPLERSLHDLGLNQHPHVSVHGIDGATVGPAISGIDFPRENFNVTPGTSDQVLPWDEEVTVARTLLQEDTGVGDADEIKCQISIHSVGIPPEFTDGVLTDQERMLG